MSDESNEAARLLGSRGGKRRAEVLSPAERKQIASQAAQKRWGKKRRAKKVKKQPG